MIKSYPTQYSFFYLCLFSTILIMLVFLYACYDKSGNSDITINITGIVTDKTNDFPIANVEIQLTTQSLKVLRTTETNEEGQYSIIYYGKCNHSEPGTTLMVRLRRAPEGYYPEPPLSYVLLCIEEIQTFNFRLRPQSELNGFGA